MLVKDQDIGENYAIYNGDCVEVMKGIPSDSVHFSIYSPPFASLYTYSNSPRDLGNCKSKSEFYEQFIYAVSELFRIIMPGRLMAVHCMNLPTSKERDGFIGIDDFRGELIRIFQNAGFIYHSEVCIFKDPVTAMQRTKALGLLHKTIRKDSAMSRQGIPDYVVVMRKPGINPEPVNHFRDDTEMLECGSDEEYKIFPVSLWQKYASPIWMDINPSNTLQKESAREEKDERHICPLQLQVIERCINLWTNKNDIVFSPFCGIGSELWQALKMGRRAVGVELKDSYYRQAILNCHNVDVSEQVKMF
jgi:DNA modification methylase